MEDKLFEVLDDLNIRDTKLLLDKDINLSLDSSSRKRIERSIKKKTGYYNENNMKKINNILGGILMKKKIALALSAAVILSLGGGTYAYAKTPVAFVSVDINPSVELGVNAFDKVVSVEAYNEDGQKVLEGTNLVNYDIDNAVSTVITNAISEGYITQDVTTTSAVVVEITTSTDKENVATELNESLKEVADETLDNNDVDAEVETENVALARRDEARKLGITPGKLNLIQKLQALDPTINVEDYKARSVKDIQKKTKELRKNITDDSTNTDTDTDTNVDTDTNTDTVTEENTQEGTVSKTSVDSEGATIIEPEKNNNASDHKDKAKKEENRNINSKKEEKSNGNEEKNTTIATPEKQDNSNNVNSQGKSNSTKSENSSNSNSGSKSNSSKSDNSDNGSSSSQNKGKSKNN